MTGTKRNDGPETSVSIQPTPMTVATSYAPFSENSPLQITSHRLNGKNYLQWSLSVKMVIRGRGIVGYLDGTAKNLLYHT